MAGVGVGLRYTHQILGGASGARKSGPFLRGFIEAGYFEEDFSDIDDNYWQAGVGGEARIAEKLFLQFVIGDTFGSEIDRSGYLSAQLKCSFTRVAVN